jgi:hypothetical protein
MASSATSGFRGSRSFALDAVRVQDFNADIRGATGGNHDHPPMDLRPPSPNHKSGSGTRNNRHADSNRGRAPD